MKRKIALLLIFTMVLLTLVACTQEVLESETVEDISQEPEAVEEAVEEEAVEVVEDLRIVTTYLPATDLVLALQGKDSLVAADDKSVESELLKNLNPKHEIKAIGSKKNGVNIEEIIGLEPDLVVLYPTKEGDDTEKTLTEQGIKVISISPETIESLQADILQVAIAMNKEDLGLDLNAYMDEKINMVKDRVSDIEEKKTVYLAGSRGVFSTHSGDFYQHELIDIAGGDDLSKDLLGGWNEISAEQVITWNPDVIVTVNYSPDNKDSILDNPAISSINAIKDKEVYTIPSNIESWDMPKPSSILGIIWMGKTLYPEKFNDIDLKEEADNLYSKYYGKSFRDLGGNIGEEEQ